MRSEERRHNRTERLFAIVLLLQNRPNLTSRDLAEHFSVSRRTIFRDLRALTESGVPLTYAEGGGYEILEGYQLPPLMLSAREAATLLVGTEFMKLQSDASLREDADNVALKIRSVLPSEVQDYIDRLMASTVLDPYWLNTFQNDEALQDGKWYKLSQAVADRRSVIMEYYVPSRDELTRRRVDPLGLVYYTDHWNLIAFDHLRESIRNFRLDRINMMHVLMERFEKPPGFDLARHLEERGMGASNHRIKIRFSKRVFSRARASIPAKIEEQIEHGDGYDVVFYFENLKYIADWLLRYGTDAEALAPADLKHLMRENVEALLAQYGQAQV